MVSQPQARSLAVLERDTASITPLLDEGRHGRDTTPSACGDTDKRRAFVYGVCGFQSEHCVYTEFQKDGGSIFCKMFRIEIVGGSAGQRLSLCVTRLVAHLMSPRDEISCSLLAQRQI